MSVSIINAVNCGFCWVIVGLAIAGYLVTVKRTHQRWSLWIVLATGWTLLAVPNTLLVIGIRLDSAQLNAIWLSSYLLVMASIVLLFLKLVDMVKRQGGH